LASDSLKALLKRTPDAAEFLEVYAEIKTGSSRTCAIVGGTLVELHLETLIKSKMRNNLTKTELNELFNGIAPLSSFSAKIKVGYAFSLYSSRTRDNLDWIREIRNAFAHSRIVITFDTPEVKQVVARLMKDAPPVPNQTSQQAFTRAAMVMAAHLSFLEDGKKGMEWLD
jgi:hypothetical protein